MNWIIVGLVFGVPTAIILWFALVDVVRWLRSFRTSSRPDELPTSPYEVSPTMDGFEPPLREDDPIDELEDLRRRLAAADRDHELDLRELAMMRHRAEQAEAALELARQEADVYQQALLESGMPLPAIPMQSETEHETGHRTGSE